jgi:MoxR-like ATPase
MNKKWRKRRYPLRKEDQRMNYLDRIASLERQVGNIFVSNSRIIHDTLIALFAGLHLLIEDIPGVGKTTLARTLAKSTGLDFGRIQFTPDLLPGDILGMTVWSAENREFVFRQGAIMHQFVLADEINRATARTQSAMLEAMQEHSVTVDGRTYPLGDPFFVIATQNPVSFAGTFELPEAQLDRFGISFSIGYPTESGEKDILRRFGKTDPIAGLESVLSASEIVDIRKQVRGVYVSEKVMDYLVRISDRTRKEKTIKLGASPRASQCLLYASQAEAFLSGRDCVIPEDVKTCAMLVLPHRIILSADARMENISSRTVISELVAHVPIPSGVDNEYRKN